MRIGARRFVGRLTAALLGLGLLGGGLAGVAAAGEPTGTVSAPAVAAPAYPRDWCSRVLLQPDGRRARRCIDHYGTTAYLGSSYRYRQMSVSGTHPLVRLCRMERDSVLGSDGQRGHVSGRLLVRTAYGLSTPGVQYKRVGSVSYGRAGIFVYGLGRFVPYGTGSWRRVIVGYLPGEPAPGWGVEPTPWPNC